MVTHSGIFRQDLLPDEKIVWTGKPTARLHFYSSDALALLTGLTLLGASSWSAYRHWNVRGDDTYYWLVNGGLFLVGVYFTLGRFFHQAWKKRRTFYALSNKRALVVTSEFGQRQIRSCDLNRSQISILKQLDKSGTLYFNGNSYVEAGRTVTNPGFLESLSYDMVAFHDLPDVDAIYRLASETK